MAQVFWRVRQLDDRAGDGVAVVDGHQVGWMRLSEDHLEHRRLIGEKSSVESELDVLCNQDDRPVAEPKFWIPVQPRSSVSMLAAFIGVGGTSVGVRGARLTLGFLFYRRIFCLYARADMAGRQTVRTMAVVCQCRRQGLWA